MDFEIVIENHPDFRGDCTVIRVDEAYFAVSYVPTKTYTYPNSTHSFTIESETLAFPCDKDGNVTSWSSVAGGSGISKDEVIRELALGIKQIEQLPNL